ncbi:MAG: type II toxin-antitoxin system RelE family toxin [Solirubrobacteraceae bacterium]
MAEPPPSFDEIRARLAALRAERETTAGGAAPTATPTPDQLDAMRETMGILSDPEMLARIGRARRAVASADVVRLDDLSDASSPTPSGWRVAMIGPVARELSEGGESSGTVLREVLGTLLAEPAAQGRLLGLGLAGMRSLRGGTYRVLYAIDDEQRLVTVLSVDQP